MTNQPNPFENLSAGERYQLMILTERDRVKFVKEERQRRPALKWPHGSAPRAGKPDFSSRGFTQLPRNNRLKKIVKEKYPGQSKRYLVGAWRES